MFFFFNPYTNSQFVFFPDSFTLRFTKFVSQDDSWDHYVFAEQYPAGVCYIDDTKVTFSTTCMAFIERDASRERFRMVVVLSFHTEAGSEPVMGLVTYSISLNCRGIRVAVRATLLHGPSTACGKY